MEGDGGRRGRDDVASDRVIEVEKRRGRRAARKIATSLAGPKRASKSDPDAHPRRRARPGSLEASGRARLLFCRGFLSFPLAIEASRSLPRERPARTPFAVRHGPSASDPRCRDRRDDRRVRPLSARRSPRVSSSWRSPFRAPPRPTLIAVPRLTLPILPPFRASDPRPMRRTSTSTSARPSRARRRPTTRRR